MSSFGFRPHFSQRLEMSVDEAGVHIIEALSQSTDECEVKKFPGFICIRIPKEDRHFWSPRLTLSIDENDEGQTEVTGTYGPNANVWALFLYGYLIIGSIVLFSGILCWVQYSLGHPVWSIWVFGFSLAAALALYLLAQLGQKLGAAQTYRIHQIYESAMGRTEDPH